MKRLWIISLCICAIFTVAGYITEVSFLILVGYLFKDIRFQQLLYQNISELLKQSFKYNWIIFLLGLGVYLLVPAAVQAKDNALLLILLLIFMYETTNWKNTKEPFPSIAHTLSILETSNIQSCMTEHRKT